MKGNLEHRQTAYESPLLILLEHLPKKIKGKSGIVSSVPDVGGG
jgi:hypothetical protein